jgi:DNA-directed RNA polymerase specialized sigma subunit
MYKNIGIIVFSIIRWVVESVNGKLKCWKYLANIIPNSQIPYIGEYVSLVSAIVNKYCKPLNPSQVDDEHSEVI